ncbi:MAG: hypothetical protein PHX58_04490 [Desulfovibrio sp.]|jgi:hypothetical protein|nr:hypothetical protein [Desulfovibrio sp.]
MVRTLPGFCIVSLLPCRVSALVLLLLLGLAGLAGPAQATGKDGIPLATGGADFFEQATKDGVPADFLSSRSVAARMVQYKRPLVDMLSELEGSLAYKPLQHGHALLHRVYSPEQGEFLKVEYRFVYHPETKEAELTDVLVNGLVLDNYDFYNYADELGRPKRP